jgi:xanthine dehydrogenase YagT iron-sulfur-binding subunit
VSQRDDRESKGRLSRRSFLAGTGVTAATAGLLEGCKPADQPDGSGATSAEVVGPGRVAAVLHVNGQDKSVTIEPRATLAEVLRDELGLTGTKVVCDRGACSACTVWLDQTPVNACMTFALDAVGREVTTIEALSVAGTLHPVQRAFIEHDAMQCGFCTPGMVMSCAALLRKKPTPSADDVRTAVSGNLCRCGTYPKVISATLAAAGRGSAS